MKKQLHVISHTHWDFEWYFSAHESLIQLIYHLEEVMDALENGEVDNYYLDGQLSIVEDYLSACPQHKERFCHLVESGKLKIGPWYSQTDQLIISGESIIRNLQLGIRLGESLGGCEMLGYVPDAFGQSMDMPKIYNGVGIDKTVFWRGLSTDVYPYREGQWQSEDGSHVLFYNIKDGYYVGGQLIYSDDAISLTNQVEKDCLSDHVALPLGGDQRFVDRNVKERIALFNQKLADANIDSQLIESSYDKLFASLNAQDLPMDTLSGEMIDGQVSKIHRSIYSSRADHKRLNDMLERRITLELEPLMALATRYGIGYQPELINNLWRTMTRNHAHDSAGGCNTDKTNKIILERFEQVDQTSSAARDYLVRKLADSQPELDNGTRLTLFNTLPVSREQVQDITLSTKSPQFTLSTLAGENVAFDVTAQTQHYNGSIQRNPEDNDPNGYYYQTDIAVQYALPALGFTSLVIQEVAEKDALVLPTVLGKHIENDRYRIDYQNGELNLTDKQTGQHWPQAFTLRDGGDDGDTYDYSPPENDWVITLSFSHAACTTQSGQCKQQMTLKGSWLLPENLEARAQGFRDTVCEYTVNVTLTNDEQPLQIDVTIDNQADDHRLQIVINSPIKAKESIADTPFGFARRPLFQTQLADWRERGWKEEPCGIYPMINYANLHDEQASLTVFAQGIKEYEVLIESAEQPSGTLALTLFRSVGWLGKPDLLRRPGIASGQQFKYIPTPDSQMKGHQHITLGLHIDPSFSPATAVQQWQTWSVKTPYYQAQTLNQFTNTLKYFVMHQLDNAVKDNDSLFTLDAPHLVCSSVQFDNNALYVRLFNPSEYSIENTGSLTVGHATIKNAADTNLMLKTLNTLVVDGNVIQLGDFRAKQIRTIKIMLD
ncbi:glycoside hydrolase family 38 C-terminal domain-containing protein [Enterovibrio norvegicus]|uniref:Mannosylglycerate hydrolase n=1 Tax=Enterovibrio norvegicus DSM 15893 TaxID=1121869 RepID=A0A1I5TUA5_9GAMM|nr:glycoside hydrolase family 38 C-terminal domain-containing protein [Enterovibrio norvegicus]SFP86634.1 mannosylglycerate hydrolase [Enterovibrio norvegicus DSM 15893]